MNYFIGLFVYTIASLAITALVPVLVRYAIWRKPIRNKWIAGMITAPSFIIGGFLGGALNKGHGFWWAAVGSAVISYGILRAGIDTTGTRGGDGSSDFTIEKIHREVNPHPVEEARRVVAYPMSEETGKNQEFVALLKSAAHEKKLDTIPDEDLSEIYKRARSIEDASGKSLDIELSRTINVFLAEIKKRGLSYQ